MRWDFELRTQGKEGSWAATLKEPQRRRNGFEKAPRKSNLWVQVRCGGRAVSRVGDTGVRLQFGAAASADAAADDDERVGEAKAQKIAKSARARGFRPSESLIDPISLQSYGILAYVVQKGILGKSAVARPPSLPLSFSRSHLRGTAEFGSKAILPPPRSLISRHLWAPHSGTDGPTMCEGDIL